MCGKFLACGVELSNQEELWGHKHMGMMLAIRRIDFDGFRFIGVSFLYIIITNVKKIGRKNLKIRQNRQLCHVEVFGKPN